MRAAPDVLRRCCRRAVVAALLLAAALSACAPSAGQLAEVRADQQWAADYRRMRQQCSQAVPGACLHYERARESFEAYVLYNSLTLPGLATPAFFPVAVSVHPIAVGGVR